MRILIGIWLTILITSCCQQTSKKTILEEQPTELKVMVWNILHGGKNKDLPVDGRPDVINIIRQTQADVILMIETYGCAPMVADSLAYNYELLSSNLCIYSRYPIVKKYKFPDQISTFNFGGVQIDVYGQRVNLFDTWLHYLPDTRKVPLHKTEAEILDWENEGSRDDEIKIILATIDSYIRKADSIPVIMGGDFNSHSHLDWTESTKNMYYHGGAVVNWTVSKAMADAGFEDTFRKIYPDPTKNMGTTWLSVWDEEGNVHFTRNDRIDYLYSKGSHLEVKESYAGVVPFSHEFFFKGKTYSNYPSDHGFVVTTFELKPKSKRIANLGDYESLFDDKGNELKYLFIEDKEKVKVVINQIEATLLQESSASGLVYKNKQYELVLWHGKTILKEGEKILFETK